MTRYFAFLRAINVGGRTVRMEALRACFESFGLADVETFLASGNVVFLSEHEEPSRLESVISHGLRNALGFDVPTFIRSERELEGIAAHRAFSPPEVEEAKALNVIFLKEPLDRDATERVMSWATDIDAFAVNGREIHWLCRTKQSESAFSNAVLERRLRLQSTIRSTSTITRIVRR